jgi:dTDP-4-amino-4,6-dideoxygalactose transaminase
VENPMAAALSPVAINLPSALNLTAEQVRYVAEAFQECLATLPN